MKSNITAWLGNSEESKQETRSVAGKDETPCYGCGKSLSRDMVQFMDENTGELLCGPCSIVAREQVCFECGKHKQLNSAKLCKECAEETLEPDILVDGHF